MIVRSWLVGADSKRLHLAHEMTSDGVLAAMQEVLFVHVSLGTRRVVAMDMEALGRAHALAGAPAPDWLGRRIGLPLPAA
jgi:acyl-CoA thioesterase FadM